MLSSTLKTEAFMAEHFLPEDETGQTSGSGNRSSGNRGDREPVRLTVSGSQRGITGIMQQLYSTGFAQMHEWSRPQRHPRTGIVFCILTKYLPLE